MGTGKEKREGRKCMVLGTLLFHLYGICKRGFIRRFIRFLALRSEGGHTYSVTIRKIFSTYHDIDVGLYSGKGSLVLGNFKPGTKIGRYSAIVETVVAFNANHTM